MTASQPIVRPFEHSLMIPLRPYHFRSRGCGGSVGVRVLLQGTRGGFLPPGLDAYPQDEFRRGSRGSSGRPDADFRLPHPFRAELEDVAAGLDIGTTSDEADIR